MPARSRMRAADVAHQRRALLAVRADAGRGAHALAIHQQHVRVGAAVGDAQAAAAPARPPGASRCPPPALKLARTLACAASLNATAMPAMALTCGPPCSPGKTAESILAASVLSVRQDARAARAVEGLVRGEADDVRVADRAGHDARGHHAGDVRDVGQQVRADRVGDLAEARPVGHPRVGGEAGDDHLRLVLAAPAPRSAS